MELEDREIEKHIDLLKRIGLKELSARKALYTEYVVRFNILVQSYLKCLRSLIFDIPLGTEYYEILNVENTLTENIFDRHESEIVPYLSGDKCYLFTMNEMSHIHDKSTNPYTNMQIDRTLLSFVEHGYAGIGTSSNQWIRILSQQEDTNV